MLADVECRHRGPKADTIHHVLVQHTRLTREIDNDRGPNPHQGDGQASIIGDSVCLESGLT